MILGGTHQEDDSNISIYEEDSEFIHNGCVKIHPGLKNARIISQWVGIRPGRPTVRLEHEVMPNGKIIVHNYGHGGCGVTLSWGCAENVVEIVKGQLSKL